MSRSGRPTTLANHRLRGGTFSLTQELCAAFDRAVAQRDATDFTSAALAYAVAQRGLGDSMEAILDLADFRIEDGPLLGACDLELDGELEPDTTYEVSGEISSLVTKRGRSTGPFDLLTVKGQVMSPAGTKVATVTNTFVLRRPESA